MSGVQGVSGPARPGPGMRTAPAQSGFSVSADAPQAAPAGATPPVSLAGLLALQEAGGEAVADREARRRGHDLLGELAGLQRDLLAGPATPERLERLAALAQSLPVADDPRLRAVVGEIALRARIELARAGHG